MAGGQPAHRHRNRELQDRAIAEEDGAAGLVRRRRRTRAFQRKMGKKRADFCGTTVTGMARPMNADDAAQPSNRGFFRTQRRRLATQHSPYRITSFVGMG